MGIFIRIVVAISRYLLPLIAVIILTKCVLSLVLGHPEEKTYGYIIDMSDGKSYPLNMWETSLGRSNSCDISVGYNTVSRLHAVISRRIDGWYIYDLLSKAGIYVNGKKIEKKATIHNGDILTLGLVQYRFVVADDPVVRVGKKRSKRKRVQPDFRGREEYKEPYDEYFADPFAQGTGYSSFAGQYGAGQYSQQNSNQNNPKTKAEEAFSAGKQYASEKNQRTENTYYTPNNEAYNVPYSDEGFSEKPNQESVFGAKAESETEKAGSQNSFEFEAPNKNEVEKQRRNIISRAVLTNPDTNENFALSGEFVTIGRARSNEIVLSSPSVSRRHANIVLYEDGWAIEDAGSAAGTYLNGKKISSPQLLFDGDIIALADERLYYTVKQTPYI